MNRRSWIGGAGDGDAGDDDVGELTKEILSRVDENLDEYLTNADEFVMSPLANVENRMEMTRAGNLDENVRVQDDDSRPTRDKAKGNVLHSRQVARHSSVQRRSEVARVED